MTIDEISEDLQSQFGKPRNQTEDNILSDCLTEYLALFLQLTIYFLIVVIINKVVRRAE